MEKKTKEIVKDDIKGFIEVKVNSPVTRYIDGIMQTEFIQEVELINIDNIAIITMGGNIILKRGYPNGENVCKTNHSFEELKELITKATSRK